MYGVIQAIVASKVYYSCNLFDRVTLRMEELSIIELTFMRVVRSTIFSLNYCLIFRKNNLKFILKHLDVFFIFVQICELLYTPIERKHSKKCTFYTLRFGCSFAAVNTIKPQLL